MAPRVCTSRAQENCTGLGFGFLDGSYYLLLAPRWLLYTVFDQDGTIYSMFHGLVWLRL